MSETEYVAVGEVVAPQGRVGEVRVNPLTDFPERFRAGLRLFPGRAGRQPEPEPLTVVDAWEKRPFVVLRFAGVETIDAAETLRGLILYVPEAEVFALPEGRYYVYQLLGLTVVTGDGREVGTLAEVITGPANDVYVVEVRSGADVGPRRYLIPATKEVVKAVDLAGGRMVITPIPGLLE